MSGLPQDHSYIFLAKTLNFDHIKQLITNNPVNTTSLLAFQEVNKL